jgi:uncharacterized protein (DUF58 family)
VRARARVGLTHRGWTVAGAAIGLLLGGRLLGADELSVVGLAAIALLGGSIIWVLVAPLAVAGCRRADPPRLHVGDAARIDLRIDATRPTPLLDLAETIDGGRLRVRFLVAPLTRGSAAHAAYRLPTERRGQVVLGPAVATRNDPLGFAHRRRVVAPPETVLVRPRVFAVAPPRLGAGRRLGADDVLALHATAPDAADEFLAVRPYAIGDDPRRVHWRSSARVDTLMVRQFVAPRRGHTAVLLDTRVETTPAADGGRGEAGSEPRATSPEFERAVEAAASVVTALHRARRPVECLTSAGTVLGDATGGDHRRIVDRLATIMMNEPDLLDAVASRRRHTPELVVLVTARFDARIDAARRLLSRRTPTMVVVTGGDPPGPRAWAVDARQVPFPDAWRDATRSHRPRPAPAEPTPWIPAAPSRRPSRSPR